MKMYKLACLGLLILLSACNFSFAETNKLPIPAWAQKMIDKADFSFLNKAISRKDNDIDYFDNKTGSVVPLPEKVENALQAEAKEDYGSLVKFISTDNSGGVKPNPRDVQPLKDLYSTVFRLGTPDHRELYVHLIDLWGCYGGGGIGFFLYDPKKNAITNTKDSIWVPTRWTGIGDNPSDTPLVKPYVHFEDFCGDGRNGVVAEEYFHNGTESNADVYHYFFIGDDLSFNEVLAIKTRYPFRIWKNDVPVGMSTVLRKVTVAGKNRIEVETIMEMDDNTQVDVGTTVLKCDKSGSPFKVAGKKVKNKQYKDLLDGVPWNRDDEY